MISQVATLAMIATYTGNGRARVLAEPYHFRGEAKAKAVRLLGAGVVPGTTSCVSIRDVLAKRPYPFGRDGSPSRPTSRAKQSEGGWLLGAGVVPGTTSCISIRDVLAKRIYRFFDAKPAAFRGACHFHSTNAICLSLRTRFH